MIFKGWSYRKQVASPGQPSIDRKWWDKFKNFASTPTRAQNPKHRLFRWTYICPCKSLQPHMFSFTNQKRRLEEAAGVKNKCQGAGPFLAEYMRMIFKGWPHRKKVASPGQPSIDRKWWAKFKNFLSTPTRAQNPKHRCFAEHTFVLAKIYNRICSASPTKKVTWRGLGAGVKNKFQGAGPFFGWIYADDLQRLAPQETNRITRPTIHR